MKSKHLSFVFSLIVAASLLTGCSGGGASDVAYKSEGAFDNGGYYDAAATAAEAGGSYDYDEEYVESEEREGSSGTIDENADTKPDTSVTIDREKIVYSGSLTIETLEYDDTVAKLYALIEEKGGIIQSESVNEYTPDYSSDRTGHNLDVTVRIPAGQFRPFLNGTQGIGRVKDMYTYADNITRSYYDAAARRSSLRTELDRLNEMTENADSTEDLIEIVDRIASVQGDLDSLEAQLRNMDTDVAYSTLNITVREVVEYSATPQSFGERVADAVAGSCRNFVGFMQNLVIFLIYALPVLVFLVAIAAVILFIIHIVSKKIAARPRKHAMRRPMGAMPHFGKAPAGVQPYPEGQAPAAKPESGVAFSEKREEAGSASEDAEPNNPPTEKK